MTIIITGGSGFIGSNFVLNWLKEEDEIIINLDNLSFGTQFISREYLESQKKYKFFKCDINN